MNKGIVRKSLILCEQCLKEGEETSQLVFSRTQKSLRSGFLPLLLSRTVYTSLGIIWTIFATEKFERTLCIQPENMYTVVHLSVQTEGGRSQCENTVLREIRQWEGDLAEGVK